MLTAGGEAIADIDTLRQQAGLLGAVDIAADGVADLDEVTPVALARVRGPACCEASTIPFRGED